jgi:hypothetical protein
MKYRLRDPLRDGGGTRALQVAKHIMQRKRTREAVYKHWMKFDARIAISDTRRDSIMRRVKSPLLLSSSAMRFLVRAFTNRNMPRRMEQAVCNSGVTGPLGNGILECVPLASFEILVPR